MFQLLPCSRCQRTFSVRSEVSDEALLKCPNCGNQFRLGELLDAFYAPWQVLENPGIAAGATAAAQTASAAQQPVATSSSGLVLDSSAVSGSPAHGAGLAIDSTSEHADGGLSLDGPELELAEEDEGIGNGIALESAGKEKPKTDWSKFKPISHEEFQRMKRAERSPIWSTLQVVLGGAAAIPVSLLLIWYVLDKDVAGAGPAVARYAPWIVPQKFRGSWEPEPSSSDSEPRRIPRRGESGFRNFDDVMPAADSTNAESSDSDKPGAAADAGDGTVVGTLAENGEQPEAVGKEAATNEPATNEPATNQPTIEPDANPSEASTSDAALPQSALPQSASAVDPPMADVFALLQRTKEKVEGWKDAATAEDSVKREAALALFEDLSNLGAYLSSIPDTPGAPALARDKAQEIARAIKRQPDLPLVLLSAAKAQLNGNLPRSKNGWVLVCTVGEILEQDDTWRIMVADSALLPLNVPTIEIPQSVAPQLTSGQRLLLLGKFITPPSAATTDSPPENSEEPAPGSEIFRASFSYGL